MATRLSDETRFIRRMSKDSTYLHLSSKFPSGHGRILEHSAAVYNVAFVRGVHEYEHKTFTGGHTHVPAPASPS